MNSILITNIVTILIALIAGVVAIYQVKLNVISNSRIKWIENLRDTISHYNAEITNLSIQIGNFAAETKNLSEGSPQYKDFVKEHYRNYLELVVVTDKLKNKILLYLNGKEEKHRKIEEHIHLISNKLHKSDVYHINFEEIEIHQKEIIKNSKEIFKKEWDKSKRLFKS